MGYFCHPERSEGSQLFEIERFFASLRMTIQSIRTFFNSLLVPGPSAHNSKKGGLGQEKSAGNLSFAVSFLDPGHLRNYTFN